MPRLRPAARGVVLDDADRILLVRFEFTYDVVWAAPGGGIELGEVPLVALRRELDEEVGLLLADDPPHIWHQEVVAEGHADGYDGVINDYYMVRTSAFEPRGSMSDDELAAENVHGFRWWTLQELADYEGPDLFSPRNLPDLFALLLADGPPAVPLKLGI